MTRLTVVLPRVSITCLKWTTRWCLPVDKKVRFITTSNDVIHSWWVPAFGVKRDAVPGFLREFWATVEKTGTYRGQCSELCGKEHGFMPVVVNVVSQEEFDKWLASKKAPASSRSAYLRQPSPQRGPWWPTAQ